MSSTVPASFGYSLFYPPSSCFRYSIKISPLLLVPECDLKGREKCAKELRTGQKAGNFDLSWMDLIPLAMI
jgi:hypothetical protein